MEAAAAAVTKAAFLMASVTGFIGWLAAKEVLLGCYEGIYFKLQAYRDTQYAIGFLDYGNLV